MEPYHLHSLSNSSSSSFSLPSDLRSWACNELRVLCGDSEDLDASLIDEFLSFISLSPSSLAPSSTHLAESRQHAAEGRTRQSEREDDDGEEEEQEEEEERKREEEVKDLASFIECLVAPLRHDFSPHVQAEISSFSSLFSSRLRSAYQAHLSSRESPRKPLLASSSSSSSSSPPRSPPSPHVSGAEKNDKRSISLDRRELAVNQEEEEDLKEGEVSSSSSPLRVTVTSPKEQESAGEMHTKKKKNNAPSDDGERGREQKGDVREEREEESIFEKVVERNERRSPESLGEKRKDKKGRDDERKEEERNMRVSSDSKEGVRDVHQPSAVYTPQVHKKPSSSVYHYSSPRNSPNPSSRDPFLSPSADSSSSCSSSHLPEKEEPSSPSSSFAFPHTAAQNDYLHGYHTPLEEKREESPLSGPEAETLVVKKKKKRRPAVTLDSFGISNIPYHTPQTSSSRNRDTSSQDDLPASSSSSSAITATRRKKQAKKFSIYSLEGDVYRRKRSHRENSQSSSSSLGVRCICLCMGTEHGVYGSCLYCGKVACEMEGGRDCLFCGNAIKVYSSQFQKGA
ncbi:zinc finger c2hc5-type protein, partial [Cystoisospora suis]